MSRPSPRDILLLYRNILRLHRAKLPGPMRGLGDSYVSTEFRRHRDANPPTTSAQWIEFSKQWRGYLDMLGGTADLPEGQSIPDSILDDLTPEQQAQLARLKEEATSLAAGVPRPADGK